MIWMMVCDSAHADLDVFGLTWGNQNSGLTRTETEEKQRMKVLPPACGTQHSAAAHSLWRVKAQFIPGFSH
jgi:hypothetical protein